MGYYTEVLNMFNVKATRDPIHEKELHRLEITRQNKFSPSRKKPITLG